MLWNENQTATQVEQQQDVYSDVSTPYSANPFVQDKPEFSVELIGQKLGISPDVQEDVTTNANPDLQPTSQTLTMNYQRNYSERAPVSKTAKICTISYVAVCLVLVLAITLCAVSVGNSLANATALSAQYSEVASNVATLQQQITEEDYASLLQKVTELGYIDAGASNTQTYTEIETRPAQNFQVQTNWFDSLCDWLSGAFGG